MGRPRRVARRPPSGGGRFVAERSVKIPDLLVGAAAHAARVGVLHYDEEFDRIAGVLELREPLARPQRRALN